MITPATTLRLPLALRNAEARREMESMTAAISRRVQPNSFLKESRRQATVMKPLLAPALQSFGLMGAFRARAQAQQIAFVSWVAEAANKAEAHDRIAHLLDELANEMEDYL